MKNIEAKMFEAKKTEKTTINYKQVEKQCLNDEKMERKKNISNVINIIK